MDGRVKDSAVNGSHGQKRQWDETCTLVKWNTCDGNGGLIGVIAKFSYRVQPQLSIEHCRNWLWVWSDPRMAATC